MDELYVRARFGRLALIEHVDHIRIDDRRKTVPLTRLSQAEDTISAFAQMPLVERLPVISLQHKRVRKLRDLADIGREFVVGAKSSRLARATPAQYDALASAWLAPPT